MPTLTELKTRIQSLEAQKADLTCQWLAIGQLLLKTQEDGVREVTLPLEIETRRAYEAGWQLHESQCLEQAEELHRKMQDVDIAISNIAEELSELAGRGIEDYEEARQRHWAMRAAFDAKEEARRYFESHRDGLRPLSEPIHLATERARRAAQARAREEAEERVQEGFSVGTEAALADLTETYEHRAEEEFLESLVELSQEQERYEQAEPLPARRAA